MRILILGGTVFLGRALVEAALRNGHELTLFNRGRSNPALFPEIEKLVGERDSALDALRGRRWEAVIDTCGYVPRLVRRSAERLSEAAGKYVFISSLSVYADFSQPGITETAQVGQLADETTEEVNGETYGPLKALCEMAVERAMPGRALILRPGLIVGPHDPTDRFTYWPWRLAQGGEVLTPGRAERFVQYIDVHDLAEWTIQAIQADLTGVFNTVSLPQAVSMGVLLSACQQASECEAKFTWVSDEFLLENNVEGWIEMPLWLPESQAEYAGFFAFDSSKALASGLKFRPLAKTIQATLEWARTRQAEHAWRAGMKPQREEELLRKWSERR